MRVKFDVSDVEERGDFTKAKPGLYRAEVEEINDWSGKHGKGMEVVLKVVADSKGKTKFEGVGTRLWRYLYLDYEPTAGFLLEFLSAVGVVSDKKKKGQLDTEKIVGSTIQVRLKSGRDEDGDYRPEVGKIMALPEDADAPEEEEDEAEPEAEEEEPEAEEPEAEELDLDTLDRSELKALIKEEKLDVKVVKNKSDADLRKEIAAAMGAETEEEEPEEEEEEEAGDDLDDLDDLDRKELVKRAREAGLKPLKKHSEDDLRTMIRETGGEEPEEEEAPADEAPDYDSWTVDQLKAELKQRGIQTKVSGKKALATRLRKDDESDEEPF